MIHRAESNQHVFSLLFPRCAPTKASEDTVSNKKGRIILQQFIAAKDPIHTSILRVTFNTSKKPLVKIILCTIEKYIYKEH